MTSLRHDSIRAPYRRGPARRREGVAAPPDGFIAEIVAQFADPYECMRELVQNAVDAEATAISVQLVSEASHLRMTVRDDGTGMSRGAIENDLTVLFRSSKEARKDAIGRFGIGFVSVFALHPELVEVDTSTGDGVIWTMQMHPDRHYDLFRSTGKAGVHGTRVSIILQMERGEHDTVVARTRESLSKWCKHIAIPIRFLHHEHEFAEPKTYLQLNESFDLPEALITLYCESGDGETRAVVGLPSDGRAYGAFLSHGLLIHETKDHGFGEVLFKVDSVRLEHTLSRDGVRRNSDYQRIMETVAKAFSRLADKARAHTFELAHAYMADETMEAASKWITLLYALGRAGVASTEPTIAIARWTPEGRGVASLDSLLQRPAYTASSHSRLAARLSREHSIFDVSIAPEGEARERYTEWLARFVGNALTSVEDAATLVTPISLDDGEYALLSEVRALLGRLVRKPSGIVLAEFEGYASSRFILPTSSSSEPQLVLKHCAELDVFRLLLRPQIAINATHPIMIAARKRYRSAPILTTYLLARAILADRGALTPAVDLTLTELGIQRALESGQ